MRGEYGFRLDRLPRPRLLIVQERLKEQVTKEVTSSLGDAKVG
jgi:hypothetical protein